MLSHQTNSTPRVSQPHRAAGAAQSEELPAPTPCERGMEGALPARPPRRQLTRKEVHTVCALINEPDKEFIHTLMTHVRADDPIARAVFKGICRAPGLLTAAAGERVLELLSHQGHPKYAINLALACLGSTKFTHSLALISKCAHVLAEFAPRLTESQFDRLFARAASYPRTQPVPATGVGPERTVDYGGALSVALLADVSRAWIDKGELFRTARHFARTYPEARNFWLIPLGEHDPRTLREWQAYASEDVPHALMAREMIRAALITSVSSCALYAAVRLDQMAKQQPPAAKPPPDVALVVTLLWTSGWSVRALTRFASQIVEKLNRYEVPGCQADQIASAPL